MKMVFSIVMFFVAVFVVNAQSTYEYYVDPGMIEISYTGAEGSFVDASAFVKDVNIVVGDVALTHVTHARKSSLIDFEAQLGSPVAEQKCTWKLDLSLVPRSENKIYMRYCFGSIQTNADGTTVHTLGPFSVSSDVVKLIGRPGKAMNKG